MVSYRIIYGKKHARFYTCEKCGKKIQYVGLSRLCAECEKKYNEGKQ